MKDSNSPSLPISPKQHINLFHKYRFLLGNGIIICNVICGVFGGFLGSLGYFKLASFFITLGFIFDPFDGPVARYLNYSGNVGMYLNSLADMVTFGVAAAQILFTYFKDQLLIGICVAVFHAVCVITRLAVFMTDKGFIEVFRGFPSPFGGVLIGSICAAGLPKSYVAGLSIISSLCMITWNTTYVKPFTITKKPLLLLVWLLHVCALVGVSTFTSYGNLVVALISFCYGIIPVIVRFYRWLFKHSKYPAKFDIAMTCGVYDMFHKGHFELFEHLSAMGRQVYAAVHDDESVFQLKHVRVTDPLKVRMANVEKQSRVKIVFPVDNTDPSDVFREMVAAIPPQKSACFMRGDDWFDFPGKSVFDEHKIPIIYHHYTEGISSSLLRLVRKKHTQVK